MSWEGLSVWWRDELATDPEYEATVTPLVLDLLGDPVGLRVLDVGCGEGRTMRILGRTSGLTVGVDLVDDLLRSARFAGPVVRDTLPDLASFRDGSFEAAVVSLVLEHVEDERAFFAALGRVVRPGGHLVLVVNHPIYTAPGSAPIQEGDGEITWRPGTYFDHGHTDERAGDATVRFHHRPLGDLLNAASDGGWSLDRLLELGATPGQIEAYPELARQRHIPRLLACRWSRR